MAVDDAIETPPRDSPLITTDAPTSIAPKGLIGLKGGQVERETLIYRLNCHRSLRSRRTVLQTRSLSSIRPYSHSCGQQAPPTTSIWCLLRCLIQGRRGTRRSEVGWSGKVAKTCCVLFSRATWRVQKEAPLAIWKQPPASCSLTHFTHTHTLAVYPWRDAMRLLDLVRFGSCRITACDHLLASGRRGYLQLPRTWMLHLIQIELADDATSGAVDLYILRLR